MRKMVALTVVAAACGFAQAQNVFNLSGVEARSTMLVTDGKYKSCGLRFVGSDLIDATRAAFPAHVVDFNITIGNFGAQALHSLLKTEITRFAGPQDRAGVMAKVASTWLAHEGAEPVAPLKTGIPGENGLSSMTGYPFRPWADYLLDAANGKAGAFLLGVRLASEKATRIYRFTPAVGSEDATAFKACAETMLSQMEKELSKP